MFVQIRKLPPKEKAPTLCRGFLFDEIGETV